MNHSETSPSSSSSVLVSRFSLDFAGLRYRAPVGKGKGSQLCSFTMDSVLVWCGVAWRGEAWCGVVRCGVAWRCAWRCAWRVCVCACVRVLCFVCCVLQWCVSPYHCTHASNLGARSPGSKLPATPARPSPRQPTTVGHNHVHELPHPSSAALFGLGHLSLHNDGRMNHQE